MFFPQTWRKYIANLVTNLCHRLSIKFFRNWFVNENMDSMKHEFTRKPFSVMYTQDSASQTVTFLISR